LPGGKPGGLTIDGTIMSPLVTATGGSQTNNHRDFPATCFKFAKSVNRLTHDFNSALPLPEFVSVLERTAT
jgi:hypothetical protein